MICYKSGNVLALLFNDVIQLAFWEHLRLSMIWGVYFIYNLY